jgi:hypothetical protein
MNSLRPVTLACGNTDTAESLSNDKFCHAAQKYCEGGHDLVMPRVGATGDVGTHALLLRARPLFN